MEDKIRSAEELFELARTGDRNAQNELVRHLEPRLRPIIHRQLGPDARMLAETGDILSDTLMELLRRLPTMAEANYEGVVSYGFRIARSRILDVAKAAHRHKRAMHRNVPLVDGDSSGTGQEVHIQAAGASPSQDALGHEMAQRIETALLKLGPDERKLITFKRDLDATPTGLALLLGFPSPDAARMALKRAAVRLLLLLEADASD